jgi:hypothetical protein
LVAVFATMPRAVGPTPESVPEAPPSALVELATHIMDFTVELLLLEWTPMRVGIFLIVIGLMLDGGGAYVLLSATKT